jgi:hypothetical protein
MKTSVTDGLVVKFARAVLEDELKELRQSYDNLNEVYTHAVEDLEKVRDELAIYERRYKLAIDFKNYVMRDNERLREENLEISEELKDLQEAFRKDFQSNKLKLAVKKAERQNKLISCFVIISALIAVLSAASYYFPILPEEILAPVIIKECPKQVAGVIETWRSYEN